MTSTTERSETAPEQPTGLLARLPGFLRGSGAVAVAIVVMNVATYGFQIVAAGVLGPEQYGGVARLMAGLLVVAVVQLGLQATAARRIAATPDHVGQIERVILRVTWFAALGAGALMLAISPLVQHLLNLDSIVPALLLGVSAVPLTLMGGMAGVLQGERRWGALAMLYLALGVPRVFIGTAAIAIRPTEAAAMIGVTISMFAPAIVGYFALRRPRATGTDSDLNAIGPVALETLHASLALLAFFALSNADVIIAGQVLSDRGSGLYAAGQIITKAVLFLPQFVVVVAFPSMSTVSQRRRSLIRSLSAVILLGVASTLGTFLLKMIAIVFIGGSEKYGLIEDRLWVFAVIGTLLAMLQLLVYSVLARQGSRAGYIVWVGVLALVAIGSGIASLDGLLTTVVAVDTALLVVLLAFSLHALRTDERAAAEAPA